MTFTEKIFGLVLLLLLSLGWPMFRLVVNAIYINIYRYNVMYTKIYPWCIEFHAL